MPFKQSFAQQDEVRSMPCCLLSVSMALAV